MLFMVIERFEIVPVVTSKETQTVVSPYLGRA